jgi:hypothetical protein
MWIALAFETVFALPMSGLVVENSMRLFLKYPPSLVVLSRNLWSSLAMVVWNMIRRKNNMVKEVRLGDPTSLAMQKNGLIYMNHKESHKVK